METATDSAISSSGKRKKRKKDQDRETDCPSITDDTFVTPGILKMKQIRIESENSEKAIATDLNENLDISSQVMRKKEKHKPKRKKE